jgi:hypothetical protein
MALSWRGGARQAATYGVLRPVLVAVGVLTLAGCGPDGKPTLTMAQPHGASVTFESIDGPPPAQFRTLVKDLDNEAQSRKLAVIGRDQQAAYRVRGYLAAKVLKSSTTVSWVWDVFDRDNRRALRIAGEQTVKDAHRKGWAVADDAMLKRIAGNSMTTLADFLTSPAAAPNAPAAPMLPQIALLGHHDYTPESAGIFRLFKANADEASPEGASPAADETKNQVVAGPVPLPQRRPSLAAATSAREAVTLAAAGPPS